MDTKAANVLNEVSFFILDNDSTMWNELPGSSRDVCFQTIKLFQIHNQETKVKKLYKSSLNTKVFKY